MKKAYLLGANIDDFSLVDIYRNLFMERAFDIVFEKKDLPQIAMAEAFIASKSFDFCHVMAPYKGIAYELADNSGLTVQFAKGANLLFSLQSQLIAANTEGDAATQLLKDKGFDFRGKQIAIFGTGHTALAILHACALNGANSICLISRNKVRAEKRFKDYAKILREKSKTELSFLKAENNLRSLREAFEETDFLYSDYKGAIKTFKQADLIVNATILGENIGDPEPFDISILNNNQWVLDCVCAKQGISFAKEAKNIGSNVIVGEELQKK
ncbi:MAG: hypothetical protein HUJ63_01145, partial [Enterococcus sp.]|nr:hypothetical protein [Enterococcus sp.]